MNIDRKKLLLWLVMLLVMPAAAEIYRWQDAAGKTHYSDRPHAGARPVQVDPGTTYYRVRTIYDGDTIRLQNGLKIRLLGINTRKWRGATKLPKREANRQNSGC